MENLKRPGRNETADELLQMQNEFLSSKAQPSAMVVRKMREKRKCETEKDNAHDDESKRSKQASVQSGSEDESAIPIDTASSSQKLIDNHDLSLPVVLTDIVEHKYSNVLPQLPIKQAPFPKAKQRSRNLAKPDGTKVKKSIFSLEMERKKAAKLHIDMLGQSSEAHTHEDHEDTASALVDGTGLGNIEEALRIHEENMAKLSSMSEEDIIETRNQLLEKLDPKVIEFLRSKRKKNPLEQTHLPQLQRLMEQDTIGRVDVSEATINKEEMASEAPYSTKEFDLNKVDDEINMDAFVDPDVEMEKSEKMPQAKVPFSENVANTKAEKDELDINKQELPLDLDKVTKYPHMDKVEVDKLAWMTMLPKPKPMDQKTGYTARFDFEGNLLSHTADLPTHLGLHHHGEEQEVPGYTVEELFMLSRSSLHSQRILAFQTLAHILEKHWQGLYDNCLSNPLLPQLLDAGITSLLRWALDDNSESNIAAVVYAIRNLIVCEADEMSLDRVFSWHRGHESPFLKSPDAPEGDTLDKETKFSELTDAQIVKLDVIKGLLRMDLLPRLRYIMEVCRPEASVVEHIFSILIRISRHSLESATQVMNCPRLMTTIFSNFLPLHWEVVETIKGKIKSAYNTPLWSAVKLMRILASAGRHLATKLVTDFQIMDSLICYFTLDPNNPKLPMPDYLKLSIETLRTWRILLGYQFASEEVLDLFPVLMKQLQFCASISITENVTQHKYDYNYSCCLLRVLEAAINVAGNILDIHKLNSQNEGPELVLPPLKWTNVVTFVNIVETCLRRWLHEAATGKSTESGLILLSCCLDLMASYIRHALKQQSTNVVSLITQLEDWYDGAICPLLKSENFRNMVQKIVEFSIFLSSSKPGTKRDTPTLMSLGSITWCGDIAPILKEDSPFPLLNSLANLLVVLADAHQTLKIKISDYVNNSASIAYISAVRSCRISLSNHWFSRYEAFFITNLLILGIERVESNATLWYQTAMKLLPEIIAGDEYLIYILMSSVIFHPLLLKLSEDLSILINQLNLTDPVKLNSPSGEVIESVEQRFVIEALESISDIRSTYLSLVVSDLNAEPSELRVKEKGFLIDTFSIHIAKSCILQNDWMFRPIQKLYQETKQRIKDQTVSSPELSIKMKQCLQWIYLLHILNVDIFDQIQPAIRYCHLITVFLAGNNLFLDVGIRCYLTVILQHLVKAYPYQLWKFKKINWENLFSFDDLYKQLLEHFESDSYGDNLFANAVLIPLQRCFHAKFKKLLFTEHISALRILKVPLNELIVPVEMFLNPIEEDTEVLLQYCKALVTGKLQKTWSPLMYLIAIHHLHHFIKADDDPTLKKTKNNMLLRILESKNENLKFDFLHYTGPHMDQVICVQEEIPPKFLNFMESLT